MNFIYCKKFRPHYLLVPNLFCFWNSVGCGVVSSFYDATNVSLNPNIQEVDEVRANMFDKSVDF